MKKGIAFWFVIIALAVSVFGLAACGGGGEEQKEAQQAQQEPDQQAAQPGPSAQSGGSAEGLVGTWGMTHLNGEPVEPGMGTQTFSRDGTYEGSSAFLDEAGLDIEMPSVQYSVLDDSRIQWIVDGEPTHIQEYSLEGDTLTLYVEDPEFPIQQTYQRTS